MDGLIYLFTLYGDYIDGERFVVGSKDVDLGVIQALRSEFNITRVIILPIETVKQCGFCIFKSIRAEFERTSPVEPRGTFSLLAIEYWGNKTPMMNCDRVLVIFWLLSFYLSYIPDSR